MYAKSWCALHHSVFDCVLSAPGQCTDTPAIVHGSSMNWSAVEAMLSANQHLTKAVSWSSILGRGGTNWNHRPLFHLTGLLLLSGDVLPNPGPAEITNSHHPCVVCNGEVRNQGICCDCCDRWCHPKCAWVTDEEYKRLGNCPDPWFCPACCLPSFATS